MREDAPDQRRKRDSQWDAARYRSQYWSVHTRVD